MKLFLPLSKYVTPCIERGCNTWRNWSPIARCSILSCWRTSLPSPHLVTMAMTFTERAMRMLRSSSSCSSTAFSMRTRCALAFAAAFCSALVLSSSPIAAANVATVKTIARARIRKLFAVIACWRHRWGRVEEQVRARQCLIPLQFSRHNLVGRRLRRRTLRLQVVDYQERHGRGHKRHAGDKGPRLHPSRGFRLFRSEDGAAKPLFE